MKKIVYYTATASVPILVDVPDDTDPDDVEAVAYALADAEWAENGPSGNLCWEDASKYDLSEFEPTEVEDAA